MYEKALKEYLNNKGTPKELADKYNLDIDILRIDILRSLIEPVLKELMLNPKNKLGD